MTNEQIVAMIYDLLEEIDPDIAKSYDPKTAEEPEHAEDSMADLVAVVRNYLDVYGGCGDHR